MRIEGCVVFITGAAKRVGRALALDLASRGARLVLHFNRSRREVAALKRHMEKKWGTAVHLVQGDLSRFAELKRVGKEAWRVGGPIDVLVNNASTFYPTPLGKVREAQWEDLFNVNARAPFFLSESIGLRMKRRGRGKIINIADWAALHPHGKYVPYCASKAALVAIGQGMARSLAPEVQINTILPGPILWPEGMSEKAKRAILSQTPLQRIGAPEDVAAAVRFFIEGNDYMTGSQLHVDGGRHIS
jgi:pteridine reductase